jgi:hypothetical protein
VNRRRTLGATLIEFALVLVLFLTFLLGVMDFARMLWTWNAATEATREGARFAVVCDSQANQADVLARMRLMLPAVENVTLTWRPAGCSAATCEGVEVRIDGLAFDWISPVAGLTAALRLPMPGFSTYLPREAMRQDLHSEALCATS